MSVASDREDLICAFSERDTASKDTRDAKTREMDGLTQAEVTTMASIH